MPNLRPCYHGNRRVGELLIVPYFNISVATKLERRQKERRESKRERETESDGEIGKYLPC